MTPQRYVFPLYGSGSRVQDAFHAQGARRHAHGWPGKSHIFGAIAPGIKCMLPSMSEWEFWQPSETNDEEGQWSLYQHLGPPCIVVTGVTDTMSAAAMGTDAVRALRLLKAGWFVDPALSEMIIDARPLLQRRMGAYRLAFHDADVSERQRQPFQAYSCDSQDFQSAASNLSKLLQSFSSAPRRAAPLQALYGLLVHHRANPVSSVEVAIEAFNRAYGMRLSPAHRIALFEILLDAIFGTTSPSPRGAHFRARAQAALSVGKHVDSVSDAAWLDEELRDLRNTVAHGRVLPSMDYAPILMRLFQIARTLLTLNLAFSFVWMQREPIAASSTQTIGSCVTGFNQWLTHVVSDGIDSPGAHDLDKVMARLGK